ncbi:MAG: hypothetical protein LUC20_04925 [Oscillospiraceae bacterium]|nr:hypothetical protein [Oscillospiraceae bacterium]
MARVAIHLRKSEREGKSPMLTFGGIALNTDTHIAAIGEKSCGRRAARTI